MERDKVTKLTKTFEEYGPKDIASQDEALGIRYERKHIKEDMVVLLMFFLLTQYSE